MPIFDLENTVRGGNFSPDRFIRLRDLFSNRIPKQVIHSTNPDNRFKVRKSWFIHLFRAIESYAENEGVVLDPNTYDEYRRFSASLNLRSSSLTKPDEISGANRLINTILKVPEDTGVPYGRVLSAATHASEESNGRVVLRWHGMSQDEIVSRLPNYHYTHTKDFWLKHLALTPPTKSDRFVLVGYTNAYQGEKREVSQPEQIIEGAISKVVEQWSSGSEESKRLLILAQTLPSPYIFVDPSFPWHDGPFQYPPYPVWTVAFDGYSQVSLTKHNLEVSRSEARWIDEKVTKF